MTSICTHQIALECTTGKSDKLYIIQVQSDPATGTQKVVGYYGRRGSTLKEQLKYTGTSPTAALTEAEKIEREKRGGTSGYTTLAVTPGVAVTGMPSTAPVFGGKSAVVSLAAAPVATARFQPMLASVADEAKLPIYTDSSDWCSQRKYDGNRCMIALRRVTSPTERAVTAYNRKGLPVALSSAAEAELMRLLPQRDFNDARETVLDGELMGEVFVAYDLIVLRDTDVRDLSFVERFTQLEDLLASVPAMLAPTAWSSDEKAAMRAQAMTEAWEGVMYRQLDSKYSPGRGTDLLKSKFWETCTCRVLSVNKQRSVRLALLDDQGQEVEVGNVTVPVNQSIPEPDDLVEVRYLYAHVGGSLYQPSLIGVRTDLDDADFRSSIKTPPPEKSGVSAAASVTESECEDTADI